MIYTLAVPVKTQATERHQGGAALTVSEKAERSIRETLGGGSSGTLQAAHLDLLRALADDRAVDVDLKLVVAAIEQHGEVAVRFV